MPTYLETLIQRTLWLAVLCCLAGCTPRSAVLDEVPQGTPPLLLLGEFEDDYGIHYAISERQWHQHLFTVICFTIFLQVDISVER